MRSWLLAALVTFAGCRDHFVYVCGADTDCLRNGQQGQCLGFSDNQRYCAFTTGGCLRWDDTAPSSIADRCVDFDMGGSFADMSGGDDLAVPAGSTDLAYGGDLAFDADAGFITAGCNITEDLYGVWGASTSDIWAVGASSAIYHFRGGMACEVQSNKSGVPSGKTFRAVWGRSAMELFVVGNGVILHSMDGGESWSPGTSVNSGDDVWGVGGTASKTIAAVEAPNYGIYQSAASDGASWTFMGGFSGGSQLDAVWGTSTDAWIGGSGWTYHWDGSMWSDKVTVGLTSGYASSISGYPPSTLIVAGTSGELFRSTDGGATYNKVYDAPTGNKACAVSDGFQSVWATTARVVAVGSEGCVAMSTDQGQSWKAYDYSHNPPSSFTTLSLLRGVWIDPSGALAIVVGDGGTVRANPPPPQ